MGNSLLNWVSYAHLHLQPVISNKTTYINFIFLMFLTSNSELISSLCLSFLLLGVFGSSIYFISNSSLIILKRRRHPRPNWKRLKIWRRRKFHYWIVCRCRRRPRHSRHRLDGSFFPLPHCTKHWRRRRGGGGGHAIALFERRWMDGFFSSCTYGYRPWVSEGVSNTARDIFCDDENQYFLQIANINVLIYQY